MRKTIRTSAWLAALIAVVLLFGAEGADAHEYFVGKDVPLPPGQDGKRIIQVNVGRTVTLTVKNAPMQSCSANIAATNFDTTTISVSSPQPVGAVATRQFKITGRVAGSTEIDLTVQGVDPCIENSHNPIVIQVLPDETEILRSFGVAGKSESKLLKLSLKAGLSSLGEYSNEVLDGFAAGTTPPDTAALALLEGWYQAWGGGYFAAQQTLQNLSNFGSSQLLAGGWPECTTPFMFGDGTRGAFDALRTSARVSLDGFQSKLEKQVASDIAGYGKIGAKLGISFTPSYTFSRYPEIDVSGPTRSAGPADPEAPLYFGYRGAVSWSTEFDSRSCVAFGGIAAPGSGPVRIDLWDGTGMIGTKVVPVEAPGIWDVMFDDLVAGKMYRGVVKYDGGDPGHDTGKIFVPPIRLQF